ncbi:MAG: Lar family restriction alleviation protein [Atopobiaceae bacterium]|nr:Lar family restriction alleviation protein [Atopobiaceae bacterium]
MELRPCPFCGEPLRHKEDQFGLQICETAKSGPRFSVACYRCGCRTGFHETQVEAIEAWNTRAVEQPILEAIDRLRRKLSGYHGQLKAHKDLAAHADNQRRRIGELEALYAGVKAENAKLRELVRDMVVWAYIDSQCDLDDEFAERMRELGVE